MRLFDELLLFLGLKPMPIEPPAIPDTTRHPDFPLGLTEVERDLVREIEVLNGGSVFTDRLDAMFRAQSMINKLVIDSKPKGRRDDGFRNLIAGYGARDLAINKPELDP